MIAQELQATGSTVDKFCTHTGEVVTGSLLEAARNRVADWYEENAAAVKRDNPYAEHVTEGRKNWIFSKAISFAHRVRTGQECGFSVWQRINMALTSECVPLLPPEPKRDRRTYRDITRMYTD